MELNEPLLQYFRDVTCGKDLSSPPNRSSNGCFKPLLDPDGGFASDTAERRFQFQKRNGQTFYGYTFNGHPPTDASVRSGVTAM